MYNFYYFIFSFVVGYLWQQYLTVFTLDEATLERQPRLLFNECPSTGRVSSSSSSVPTLKSLNLSHGNEEITLPLQSATANHVQFHFYKLRVYANTSFNFSNLWNKL